MVSARRVRAAEVATQRAAEDPSPAPTGRDALKAVKDSPRAPDLRSNTTSGTGRGSGLGGEDLLSCFVST